MKIQSKLNFEVFPRFYIICFYQSKTKLDDITEIISNLKIKTDLRVESVSINFLADFSYNAYDSLGYIEIRLNLATSGSTYGIYLMSNELEKAILDLNKNHSDKILLDKYNPPYVVNIGVETNFKEQIKWSSDFIKENKKDIGRWVEFYSGQFDDYSETLWNSRIANNISNRESELHFIRVNSAFIYIPKHWWEDVSTAYPPSEYMNSYFIEQILMFKSLIYCYYVLNFEITEVHQRLDDLEEKSIKILEMEIGGVGNFDNLLNQLGDQLFKQIVINRRAHSKNVLDTCFKLFEVDRIKDGTNDRIKRLKAILIESRTVQQEKLSNTQRKYFILLNAIIGSQVAFTIANQLENKFSITGPLVDFGPYVLILGVGLIAIVGLTYNWLTKSLGITRNKNKISNEDNSSH